MRRHHSTQPDTPGISVLKPLRGLDPNTYDAFTSQAQQDYPQFEILFGVKERNDAAIPQVRRLQAEFPAHNIKLIIGAPETPNGKAGMLMELARHASHPLLVVNDADIKVGPTYLSEVTAPLTGPAVGVVTCPYRAQPHTIPAFWESLGIATDFIPSTLVAQILRIREFGFGSTLAFRAADLESAGGFATVSDYVADDYQIAKRIAALGKRCLLSTYTVETALGEASWNGIWLHQLRWARTIRLTKGAAYAGLPLTHAGIWIVLAFLCRASDIAGILFLLRTLSALITAGGVLRYALGAAFSWLAPVWDLYAFCVWLTSYAGTEVRWRDKTLRIGPNGRILN